ncbi:tandem-95 repeat protein, partial [Microvirga aerophila]|uniref:tandem-95 repeat protein n=2 Tax=Microvirga aerophila TaxID=670291 RepID=UPI0013B41EE2
VLANDTDVDGPSKTIASVKVDAAQGTAEIVDGKVVFTAAKDFNGDATITYTVSDGTLSDEGQAVVKVTPVNDKPVAVNDALKTSEDTPLTVAAADLVTNDTDVDSASLSVSAVTQGGHGTVELKNGQITYTPEANFSGTDTFTYTVTDGQGNESTATASVTVTVDAVNDKPVAVDDTGTVAEEGTVTIDVLANDTDVDGPSKTIASVKVDAAQGTAEIVDGKVVFTAAKDFNGDATITYTVSDGTLSDEGQAVVKVTPVNDKPVAVNDALKTSEDTPLTVAAADLVTNDTDVDSASLSVSAVTQGGHGTVELKNGQITYTPEANFSGTDTFTYTVTDGQGNESTATASVTVTVDAVNDKPVAVDDTGTVAEEGTVTIDVLANDTDVDGPSKTIASVKVDAAQGTAEIVDGKVVFTAAKDFNGDATITYTVSDGTLSDEGQAVVKVTPVNDKPVAVNDALKTSEDTPLTVAAADLVTNDTDVDSASLSVSAVTQGGHGTVELKNGQITYTPEANFSGTDTFTYTVTDGQGNESTATASVTVTVDAVNDKPVAVDDTGTVAEEGTVTIDVLANDTDVDGPSKTIASVKVDAAQGTAEIVDGKVVFTAAKDFNGDATITYTVSDGTLSDEGQAVVKVTPVNDKPVAVKAVADQSSAEDAAWSFVVSPGTFSDVDGDALTLSARLGNGGALPTWLSFNAATQTFSGTPPKDFNGDIELTVTASDGTLSASDTFKLTITPVNDAPVAVADSFGADIKTAKIYEGTEYIIDVSELLANDTDAEGDVISLVPNSISGATKGLLGTVVENGKTYVTYTYNGPSLADGSIGSDSFRYSVSDGKGGASQGTVDLKITGLPNTSIPATNAADVLSGDKKGIANDYIDGLNGDDAISGLGGNDKLMGNNGIDKLYGGSGADIIDGGRGDDLLEGGRDNDFLTGGLGADTFVFGMLENGVSVNTGTDRIQDFKPGVDDIVLNAGVTITSLGPQSDLNGDKMLDTVLNLSNGGKVEILDISHLSLADWQLIA